MKLTVTCSYFSCGDGLRSGEHKLKLNNACIEIPDENTQREILNQMDVAVVADWLKNFGCIVVIPPEGVAA